MTPATLREDLVAWRRDFHRHPELGFQEHRTARVLLEHLAGIPGLRVRSGVAGTGVVAVLEGGRPGHTVLVRADMDGLPVQEITGAEYASTVPNVMHACGHDAHMAMLLGAIRLLAAERETLPGTAVFVFQPAEEGPGGAKPMIEAGVLDDPKVDRALGFHIWNNLPVGTIGVTDGACMANTDTFEIHIQGRGGHGAMPHLSVDSVVVAAHLITALQSIVSRNVDPQRAAVVTVGKVEAGDRHNIIAHTATLRGTARSFAPEIATLLPERVQAVAEHTAKAFGAECCVRYDTVYPATVNDAAMSELVRRAARRVVGPEKVVHAEPSLGGEDMSFFLQAVPGCYFFIGSANPAAGKAAPHHHPGFDIDEDALPIGVAVIVEATRDALAPG